MILFFQIWGILDRLALNMYFSFKLVHGFLAIVLYPTLATQKEKHAHFDSLVRRIHWSIGIDLSYEWYNASILSFVDLLAMKWLYWLYHTLLGWILHVTFPLDVLWQLDFV